MKRKIDPGMYQMPKTLLRLRIPDGPNPVPLVSRDRTEIIKWAKAVRAYWTPKGYFLLRSGLKYYLGLDRQLEDNEKLLEVACRVIDDNFSDDSP